MRLSVGVAGFRWWTCWSLDLDARGLLYRSTEGRLRMIIGRMSWRKAAMWSGGGSYSSLWASDCENYSAKSRQETVGREGVGVLGECLGRRVLFGVERAPIVL
ncbi:hypothetical protein FPV67DRAFT_1130104 [Lyophyllum atratum]|nr:hypothetical protein FPV67DRAFT_1130104 [Lyophyllum atratum]